MSQRTDLSDNRTAFSWLVQPEEVKEVKEERTVDLLIVGAGHAGTAAARGAIERRPDAEILVAEQQSRSHQLILGAGEIGHINSAWQASWSIPTVDIDEFVNDWQLRTNNRSNYALIRKYAENCGENFDWMISVLDDDERAQIVPMLKKPSPHMPKTLNGFHAYPGTAAMPVKVQNSMIRKNQELAEKKGVTFLFDTRLHKIQTKEGGVTGAYLETENGYMLVHIRKGVILAAGDYSKNKPMCRDLLTEAADLIDQTGDEWTGHGWNGDGLRLGMLAGGRMEPRSHAAMGGNYSLPGFETIGSTAVLRVNKFGKRYSNEGFGTHILGALAGARQPNGMLYGVFDSNIFEQLTYQTPCHAVVDYCNEARLARLKNDLLRAREAGKEGAFIDAIKGSEKPDTRRVLYAADSLPELAAYMYEREQDQKTFIKTVTRYNMLCHLKKDTDFGKEPSLLHPIEKSPFYAAGQPKNSHKPIGQSFKLLVTVTGLLIDENQQVLNEEYEPIPGLFATGNCSGCRFGCQYTTSLPGQSISIAQTLGKEVGEYAVT